MLTLVTGGAGSGKSAFAESLVTGQGSPRFYIATMEPYGPESRARIVRHRSLREGKGFITIEKSLSLADIDLPPEAHVLLEDLSNLLANEMFSPGGGGAAAAEEGVLSLCGRCKDLTVVTNEVFSGGAEYEGDTLSYIKELLADRIVVIDDEWCEPLKEYTWKTWGDCDREKKLEILEPIMLYFERRDFDCFMDFIAGTSIAPKKKNTGTGPDSPWYKKSEGEMRSMWDEVHDF